MPLYTGLLVITPKLPTLSNTTYMFFIGQAFYSQLILLAVQDRPFPYQIVGTLGQSCQQMSKKKMNGMPDFSSLSADDQTKLIASNVPLLHVFQEAGCIGDPDSGLTKGNHPFFVFYFWKTSMQLYIVF